MRIEGSSMSLSYFINIPWPLLYCVNIPLSLPIFFSDLIQLLTDGRKCHAIHSGKGLFISISLRNLGTFVCYNMFLSNIKFSNVLLLVIEFYFFFSNLKLFSLEELYQSTFFF